ncbi:hypothetical protein M1O19_06850 [Dehalococcoidia bacterium]|nr:hypothetical protein [Dehalococcoidia bacterium]
MHKFSAQSVLVPIDEAIAIRYATVRLELKRFLSIAMTIANGQIVRKQG